MELSFILLCIYATYKEDGDGLFLCGDGECLCAGKVYYCNIPYSATEESCNDTMGSYFGEGFVREASPSDLVVFLARLFPRKTTTTAAPTTTTRPTTATTAARRDHRRERKRDDVARARDLRSERLEEGGGEGESLESRLGARVKIFRS